MSPARDTIARVVFSPRARRSILYLFTRFLPEGVTGGRTVSFTAIVMLEMVRVAMVRARYRLSFFSNPYLIGAVLLSVLLQMAVVYVPVMNIVFKTTPLALYHWGHILAVMMVMFVAGTLAARLISPRI